ncbi:MAG: DUF3047 domain-containing protein [Gemmatimonadota bacterium]
MPGSSGEPPPSPNVTDSRRGAGAPSRAPPLVGYAVILLPVALLQSGLPAQEVMEFHPREIVRWSERAFSAPTTYRLAEVGGREAVHALCAGDAASGLHVAREVDLRETPILEWSWRVDETLAGVDEASRNGDDYPARVYVVERPAILRWRTRAINYVWANEMRQGEDWPNPYDARAWMVAVRSGSGEGAGEWQTERRDVQLDFARFHGRRTDHITHIAIMTDCDDTGERTEAWYGAIRFLPRESDDSGGVSPGR